jgi:hypothetical protein
MATTFRKQAQGSVEGGSGVLAKEVKTRKANDELMRGEDLGDANQKGKSTRGKGGEECEGVGRQGELDGVSNKGGGKHSDKQGSVIANKVSLPSKPEPQEGRRRRDVLDLVRIIRRPMRTGQTATTTRSVNNDAQRKLTNIEEEEEDAGDGTELEADDTNCGGTESDEENEEVGEQDGGEEGEQDEQEEEEGSEYEQQNGGSEEEGEYEEEGEVRDKPGNNKTYNRAVSECIKQEEEDLAECLAVEQVCYFTDSFL